MSCRAINSVALQLDLWTVLVPTNIGLAWAGRSGNPSLKVLRLSKASIV
jgi:hypothetical protein